MVFLGSGLFLLVEVLIVIHFLGKAWNRKELIGIFFLAAIPMGIALGFMAEGSSPITLLDLLVVLPLLLMYALPVFFGAWWASRVVDPLNVQLSGIKVLLVLVGALGVVGGIMMIPSAVFITQYSVFGRVERFETLIIFPALSLLAVPALFIEARCRKVNLERMRERKKLALEKGLAKRLKSEEANASKG